MRAVEPQLSGESGVKPHLHIYMTEIIQINYLNSVFLGEQKIEKVNPIPTPKFSSLKHLKACNKLL